jgi:hypothetical protein
MQLDLILAYVPFLGGLSAVVSISVTFGRLRRGPRIVRRLADSLRAHDHVSALARDGSSSVEPSDLAALKGELAAAIDRDVARLSRTVRVDELFPGWKIRWRRWVIYGLGLAGLVALVPGGVLEVRGRQRLDVGWFDTSGQFLEAFSPTELLIYNISFYSTVVLAVAALTAFLVLAYGRSRYRYSLRAAFVAGILLLLWSVGRVVLSTVYYPGHIGEVMTLRWLEHAPAGWNTAYYAIAYSVLGVIALGVGAGLFADVRLAQRGRVEITH